MVSKNDNPNITLLRKNLNDVTICGVTGLLEQLH